MVGSYGVGGLLKVLEGRSGGVCGVVRGIPFMGVLMGLGEVLKVLEGRIGIMWGLQRLCGVFWGVLGGVCFLKEPFRDLGMDLGFQRGIWGPGGDFGVK